MPIKGFETYVPTITDFVVSYTAVNAARSTPLVLQNGATLQTMVDIRASVGTAITEANYKADAEATALRDYKEPRALIYAQMGEFRRLAAYLLQGKSYVGRLLPLPKVTKDDGDLFRVSDSISFVWDAANLDSSLPAGSRPIVLSGAIGASEFSDEILFLRIAQNTISTATRLADVARTERDRLCSDARTLLKEYRAAILALYAPDSIEVQSLPKIYINPKPAPDAPKLRVEYTDGASKAKLIWTILPDVSLARFYVTMSPGARYNAKNAVRLGDLNDNLRVFETLENTIAPGATVWFKVTAVDDDGNETASSSVKVERAA